MLDIDLAFLTVDGILNISNLENKLGDMTRRIAAPNSLTNASVNVRTEFDAGPQLEE